MPLTSRDLGALVGLSPSQQVDGRISTSLEPLLRDDTGALVNATGTWIETDVPQIRVKIASGAPTALGAAVAFIARYVGEGANVLVCGEDAERIVAAYEHREIAR